MSKSDLRSSGKVPGEFLDAYLTFQALNVLHHNAAFTISNLATKRVNSVERLLDLRCESFGVAAVLVLFIAV